MAIRRVSKSISRFNMNIGGVILEKLIEEVLDKWLEIEYYFIANKAKFINKIIEPDYKLILNTIRCLDYVTTTKCGFSENYVITIVALMWEHIDKEKYNIKSFILKMLSRIGYPTSAIIIDDGFDKGKGQFFRPHSVLDMVSMTLQHQNNEITIGNQLFLLTDFQKKIWDSMSTEKVLGISAPTSAGKSFVLLLKTLSRVIKDTLDVVYIVPTLSLLNQVTEDYNKMIRQLEIKNCKIVNSFIPNDNSEFCTIYVMTQEKALAAFSNEKTAFSKKLILVADEIQNIERIQRDTDLRAKILFDTLIEFRRKKNVEQIIISGPRIEEIDNLGKNIFGKKTLELKTSISPVLNLTYSIKREGKKFYFKQYCALKSTPFSSEIHNTNSIIGYSQKRYNDEFLKYLSSFISNIGDNNQNIIFAPTSDTAKKIACAISATSIEKSSDIQDLIDYYCETINKNYAMCKTLENGVGYHHGKLPMHVRRTLEKAISEKKVQNIVCTTTLMQGVNMPAQNIIIRNPHLYIAKQAESEELSSYEMANLRGRAGRLLKDFIGRTYVLDESGFDGLDEYEQLELFEDVSVELPAGYGEKYEEYKAEINDVLNSTNTVDESMKKYGYLVSYIRQTILRYGNSARTRMKEVGITLSKEQVAAIISKMNSLKVPKEICYKNRYWDPIVLNEIYESFNCKKLPSIPTERGAKTRLDEILRFLRDNKATSSMYNQYIPKSNRSGIGRSILCNACMDWACEKPLFQILVGNRYEGDEATENIDEMIKMLQNIVAFNVPLLLKPVFDIFNPESSFLICMQAGAYRPFSRKMIELGIPRETAIYLNNSLFQNKEINKETEVQVEELIREVIREKFDELPYWIRVQLEFIR